MTLTEDSLVRMLTAAAEAGAAKVLAVLQPGEDYISQNEAYRQFGRGTVERWVKDCKVTPRRVGGKRLYSLSELRNLCRALEVSDIIVARQAKAKA